MAAKKKAATTVSKKTTVPTNNVPERGLLRFPQIFRRRFVKEGVGFGYMTRLNHSFIVNNTVAQAGRSVVPNTREHDLHSDSK